MPLVSQTLVTRRFRVVSGSCLDCAGDVQGALFAVPGVEHVDVLTAAGVVVVRHAGDTADDDIRAAAKRAGIGLLAEGAAEVDQAPGW